MTVSKALALWKVNSEVQGIDRQMESSYKDIVVSRFTHILHKSLICQKLVCLLSIFEHAESSKVQRKTRKARTYSFYKQDNLQSKSNLHEFN